MVAAAAAAERVVMAPMAGVMEAVVELGAVAATEVELIGVAVVMAVWAEVEVGSEAQEVAEAQQTTSSRVMPQTTTP